MGLKLAKGNRIGALICAFALVWGALVVGIDAACQPALAKTSSSAVVSTVKATAAAKKKIKVKVYKPVIKSAYSTTQTVRVALKKLAKAKKYVVSIWEYGNKAATLQTVKADKTVVTFKNCLPNTRYRVQMTAIPKNKKRVKYKNSKCVNIYTQQLTDASEHEHVELEIPTASHSVKSSGTKYYKACYCGMEYDDTFTYESTYTESNIDSLIDANLDAEEGGIALVGTSILSRWTTAAIDFNWGLDYPMDKVYNFASGSKSVDFLTNTRYLNAVAAKKPSVIVIDGINYLRSYKTSSDDYNQEAALVTFNAHKEMVQKLHALAPDAKFIFTSPVRTPSEYKKTTKGSCSYWNRIQRLDNMLIGYASELSYVNFFDVEQFYLFEKEVEGERVVYYYTDITAADKEETAISVDDVVAAYKADIYLDPYFYTDVHHPSTLAYQEIWLTNVAKAAVDLATGALQELPAVSLKVIDEPEEGDEGDEGDDAGDEESGNESDNESIGEKSGGTTGGSGTKVGSTAAGV